MSNGTQQQTVAPEDGPVPAREPIKEYVVTVNDTYVSRYASPGLTLPRVIERESGSIMAGHGLFTDDYAIWERGRLVALLRPRGQLPPEVIRLDRLDGPEDKPDPRQRGPIEPTDRPPWPFAMGSMTFNAPHDEAPLTLEWITISETPGDDERTAGRWDLPRLLDAGWREHRAGPLTIFVRVVADG
jgi:hypothetical protein